MKLFWQFMIDFLANKSATASQDIALTHSVPGKLKNSIFEIPIITQTLNINNLRATSAKSFNLHTVRKLVEYSLKMFGKGNVYSYHFRDIPVRR